MTQDEKQLLLVDLSARLPYRVKGNYQNSDDELLRRVTIVYRYLEPNGMVMTGDIKPYLFPMSSMTKEQKIMIRALQDMGLLYYHLIIEHYNEWHLDYRGLIEKSLALDATNLGIYE